MSLTFGDLTPTSSSDSGYFSTGTISADSSTTKPATISAFVMPPENDPKDLISLDSGVNINPQSPVGVNFARNLNTNPEGHLVVCFDGTDPIAARYRYTGSIYQVPATGGPSPESLVDFVRRNADHEGLYILSGYHSSTAIERSTLGYADGFNISYTLTVLSNNPVYHVPGCVASGP